MSTQKDRQRARAAEEGSDAELLGRVRPTDILVGRGYQYERHPGNVMFYQEIDAVMEEYHSATTTKREKSRIVNRIHQTLTATTGRFVQRVVPQQGSSSSNSNSSSFKVVPEKVAKQKISHALRYRRRASIGSGTAATTTKGDDDDDTNAARGSAGGGSSSGATAAAEGPPGGTARPTTTITGDVADSLLGRRGGKRPAREPIPATTMTRKTTTTAGNPPRQPQASMAQGGLAPTRDDDDDTSSHWDALSWPELHEALGHPREYHDAPRREPAGMPSTAAVRLTTRHDDEAVVARAGDATGMSETSNPRQDDVAAADVYPFQPLRVGVDELSPLDGGDNMTLSDGPD